MTLEARGDADLAGALYDRYGHRLAADDRRSDAGLRLVRTLGPGRYFVRIESAHGAEGTYEIALAIDSW